MKVEFFISGARGCYQAGFKIGVQSFHVCERETKKEALWFKMCLEKAFENLSKEDIITNPKEIGKALKQIRESMKLTQEGTSKHIWKKTKRHIDPTVISRMEGGKFNLTLDNLNTYLNELGYEVTINIRKKNG